MDNLVNMIYDTDLLMVVCKMFMFTFSIEVVLGIANLIKTMGRGARS